MKTIRRYMSPKLAAPEDRIARYVPALVPSGTLSPTFTGPISGTPPVLRGKGDAC